MKEIKEIIAAYHTAVQYGKRTALATVVQVEGSSYRRPGARMLVTEDGELTGAISGGCLEGDALRKALLAINQQQNKLVTYDSMDEEDNTIGIQLGCNGIVHILFEPILPGAENNPIVLLEQAAAQTSNSILLTLFSLNKDQTQYGTCRLFTSNNNFNEINIPLTGIEDDLPEILRQGQSVIKQYEPGLSALIQVTQPPVQLIIAGAGNDVFPLVQMANILGWQVTVADGRKTHATVQRFREAQKIIVAKPAALVQQIDITPQTVFVLMSHNYNYDLAMLKELVNTRTPYIGVLGPKKKLQRMLSEIESEGITVSDKRNIYGPTGLDIGAETAEEIALSIIAEIKAVLAQKNGATLRDKDGFIHEHHFSIAKHKLV